MLFLGTSLWGPQKINTLKVKPIQILPSMNRVLENQESIIGEEVCLAIRRLIKKYGEELNLEWDLLIKILYKLKSYPLKVPKERRGSSIQVLSQTLELIMGKFNFQKKTM